MPRLTHDEVANALAGLPGWNSTDEAITREFTFKGFKGAIAFVNRVAEKANEARHHPDLDIRYNHVTVTLSTHDEGGVTEKDVALAREIDSVTEPPQG